MSFANEYGVRLRFQLNDAELISSELVLACIEDAHAEVLRTTKPDLEPDAGLTMGEILLAGAYLYRALSARDALRSTIESSERCRLLASVASMAEAQAWYILEPYIGKGGEA